MSFQPITIGPRSGTVLFMNESWQPVERSLATFAHVAFEDGGSAFYKVSALKAAGGPGSGRYPKGSGKANEETDARAAETDALYALMRDRAKEVSFARHGIDSMYDMRSNMKAQIVEDLHKRLQEMNPDKREYPFDDQSAAFVQKKLDQWADTSGDHNIGAIQMQHAVAQEFQLKDAALLHLGSDSIKLKDGTIVSTMPDIAGNRQYVRAEYENTQAFFKEHGIMHVSLFRGQGLSRPDSVTEGSQDVTMQPASSWTTTLDTAYAFATNRQNPVMMVTRVPVARVLSTAITGRGCLSENEVILLGGKLHVNLFDAMYSDIESNGENFLAQIKKTLK